MKKKKLSPKAKEVFEEGGFEMEVVFDLDGNPITEISGVKGKKCSHITNDLKDLLGGVEDSEVETEEFFQIPETPQQVEKEKFPIAGFNKPTITGFEGSGGSGTTGGLPASKSSSQKPKEKEKRRRKA